MKILIPATLGLAHVLLVNNYVAHGLLLMVIGGGCVGLAVENFITKLEKLP